MLILSPARDPTCAPRHTSVTGPKLPTRLIDVGPLNGPLTCRLVYPEQPLSNLEYLTLSHKWGGASVFKLTKATIESLRQGVDTIDLPLTFQHAIFITRKLEYRYLWIDSLCIIQDDPSDWAFESKTMSRIYSNSVLTLAALWGDDSNSGCFVERNPLATEDCRIGQWEHGNVFVRSGDRKRGQSLDLVQPKPLLQRAWVLQERFLSPRTLFYGPWELLWECGERAASETQPDNTPGLWGDTLKSRFKDLSLVNPGPILNKSYFKMFSSRSRGIDFGDTDSSSSKPNFRAFYKSLRTFVRHFRFDLLVVATHKLHPLPNSRRHYNVWIEIRAAYWSCQLTHHSDSLVAISGITTQLEHRTNLHFKFGLCIEFLTSELLWAVKIPDQTSRSTLSPTWSWASVERASLKSANSYKDFSKRSIFHTRIKSNDKTFGMDTNQRSHDLHLSGPLLHTTLRRNKYGHFFRATHGQLPEYGYEPDIPLPDTIDIVCLVIVEWDEDYKGIDLGKDAPGFAGLMLIHDPHEASVYQRVGIWSHERYIEEQRLAITPADVHSIRLV
ncbi:MAG: hypothetical protein Q9209_002988 [Squamulea sp. 1 TL-2023]